MFFDILIRLSQLNSNLTNLDTISSGVTVTMGGGGNSTGTLTYYRIGKIVLVNGRIYASESTTSVHGVFSGLPTPTQELFIPTSGGIGKFVDLRSDGGLRNYSESGSGTVSYFNFCYFSND